MVDAMELLRSNLSRVRIPKPTNRIYKQECCVSFDTPKSGVLFIDMSSFLAFGKDYVNWNYEKTGNPVYLHIKQTKKVVSEDRPSKKPTILAIGRSLTTHDFSQVFGDSNVRIYGDGSFVNITLDRKSGFVSKDHYNYGFFSAAIKLPFGFTSGVLVANNKEYMKGCGGVQKLSAIDN